MDKDLFYISLFMIVIGVAGQLVWVFFAGIPCVINGNPYLLGAQCNPHATAASFQELQNITGYMMVLGFIILPAGLFKDGLPSPGTGAKILVGFLLVVVVGLVFTTIILLPNSQSSATVKANGFIAILPGSGTPGTLITFSPQNVTVVINQNNTVQWTNNDNTVHTVTSSSVPSGASSFNSGLVQAGGTFTYTFTIPGVYNYICSIHPGWMHGTVKVIQAT